MTAIELQYATPTSWVNTVMNNFDAFLLDHAAAEKKASGMAMSMLSHYPDRPALVMAMADLAIEELSHYREVVRWIHQRGLITGRDERDPYVLALRELFRRDSDEYLLDRLLIAGVIEARGAERFGLVADALPPGPLKQFYLGIARSEERHHELFIKLAREYFADSVIQPRLATLLEQEALITAGLPIRAALH